jgi:hypothetical protein
MREPRHDTSPAADAQGEENRQPEIFENYVEAGA